MSAAYELLQDRVVENRTLKGRGVPIWSFGLLHLGLVARTFRKAENRNQPRQ